MNIDVADVKSISLGERHLHGPGPSEVYPSVIKVLQNPMIGHLDPDFVKIMEEVKALLRFVFQTDNEFTLPISGTGSAGMEAAVFNIVEPGDSVLVCTNGYFGGRISEMARRCGAELHEIKIPWGQAFTPEAVESAVREFCPKVVCIVQAETSTGVLQPLADISAIAHEHGALLLVDAVTSLGGVPVSVDKNQIDICYSGTQKCLSSPPGLAPITFGPAAVSAIEDRKSSVQSWYLDLILLKGYWGQERVYHHTAPITMNLALHESLRVIANEGLDACFARHRQNHLAFVAGLEAIGLSPLVPAAHRLPSLTTVQIPEGIDEARVRSQLLTKHHIEIGAGLGELKGKVWRVGLMGYSSRREATERLLDAFEDVLEEQGWKFSRGASLAATQEVYADAVL